MLVDAGRRRRTSRAGSWHWFRSATFGALPLVALATLGILCAAWTAAPAEAQTPQPVPKCVTFPNNVLLSLAVCCAHSLQSSGSCRAYDAKDEYVILKDHDDKKPAAYLIIPTVAIPDIGSSKIFDAPFVDFWEYGWQQAGKWVGVPQGTKGVPPDRLALAINSQGSISQHQLHIHLACIRPDVAKVLAAYDQDIGFDPAKPLSLRLPPHQNEYAVVKDKCLTGTDSPFKIVSRIDDAGNNMANQSVAVSAAKTAGVFYVMDTSGAAASAEELLDQGNTCTK